MNFLQKKSEPVRSSMPFVASGWIHGFLLAWVALSPPKAPSPRSLYEQEIQPHEKHIVWYSVRDRLPDIGPGDRHNQKPPRAREKFDQTIVAGAKDIRGPRQMISMPAPEIRNPDPLPLPNVVVPAPRPVKPFTAPAEKHVAGITAPLPEAPRVTPPVGATRLPFENRVRKADPKAFTPPPARKPQEATPAALPDAPAITAAVTGKDLKLAADPRAPRRAFRPPPAAKPQAQSPAPLPDAPGVTAAVQAHDLALATPDPRAPHRAFTPPPSKWHAPAPTADLPAAPDVDAAPAPAEPEAALAIVGMNPVKAPDFPTPPGSRKAGFSAGPEIRPKGGDGADGGTTIVVPGLLVRGGAKDDQPTLVANASPTSRENLLAAARAALSAAPGAAPRLPGAPAAPHAARVSSAPDPRLDGRAIYTIAIQMPNITSYSGSWMVWFADHNPEPGNPAHEIHPPVPLRKVDPKYIAAAVEEKVEGVVRLFAIIRKDGRVDSVALVRHLDDRLDHSAEEALAQWIFQPAVYDGSPIEVDAVFEIPFHLAPRPAR